MGGRVYTCTPWAFSHCFEQRYVTNINNIQCFMLDHNWKYDIEKFSHPDQCVRFHKIRNFVINISFRSDDNKQLYGGGGSKEIPGCHRSDTDMSRPVSGSVLGQQSCRSSGSPLPADLDMEDHISPEQ